MKPANHIRHALGAATLLLVAAGAAQAQAVRSERNMSLELASQIAGATVAACLADGYNVTAAVVDRAGQLRALHRADNAGPHTIGAAQAKAYTSASTRSATLAMMARWDLKPLMADVGRLRVPVILALGQNDRAVPPETTRALAGAFRDASFMLTLEFVEVGRRVSGHHRSTRACVPTSPSFNSRARSRSSVPRPAAVTPWDPQRTSRARSATVTPAATCRPIPR